MTTTTTPTGGAAIQRYKIGYREDDWGQRSSTPSGIPDASGSWVRYEDHIAALAAGQVTAAPENIRGILARCRDFIDTTKVPAYPSGADLSDEIDALLAAPQPSHAVQAVVQDDLITIRKPTTSAELLWLLKLAHLVISDVDKTMEESFAPSQLAQCFDAADMATAAAQGFRDGVASVTNNRPSLEDVFRGRSDRAYYNFIKQIGSDVCLGWEYKSRHGMFGEAELKGHTLAGEMLGRHKAFDEAANTLRASHGQAPAGAGEPTEQPGDVVAYLDVGAGGYLDLGSDLSEDALQQLPKGRHALVIAGTYGIDGYTAASTPQSAPAWVQEDAARWHWMAEYLVGTRTDLDDELIACPTVDELGKLVDADLAARKQGEKQ